MQTDGYSLDDKRNPIKENNIPDIVKRFKNREEEMERRRTEKSFMVPVEELKENDYDLSINKYKEIEYDEVEYEEPLEIIKKIEIIEQEIVQGIDKLKDLIR